MYDVKGKLASLSISFWDVKFLEHIWKKLYYLVKVAWEVTEQHKGGKTCKEKFRSDANRQRTAGVRHLDSGVKVLCKLICMHSMNI